MNLEIKPINVYEAREFLVDTVRLVFRGELTHEAAVAKVEFLWDCIVHSMLKNKEEWDGKIADYGFLDEQAQWLKSRVLEQKEQEIAERLEQKKFAQATIDTQKDKVVVDGVQVHHTNLNLDIKTEFVYQMGKKPRPHKKHKKLTIEWIEQCDSNPVNTVAPPPPSPLPVHTVAPPPPLPPLPPLPTHYISEMNKSNFSLFGWLVKPKEQAKTQKEKEQEEQIAAILAKKIEARKEGRIVRGYQSIVKIID